MEYLRQDEETGKYKSWYGDLHIMSCAWAMNLLLEISLFLICRSLSNWSGERVYLGVPHEDEVIYVNSTYPEEAFSLMRTIMGERAADVLHRSWKSHDGLSCRKRRSDEYLKKELTACTDYTITDAEKLKEELAQTRRRGYAIDNMEHEFGVKCVAMPIFNQQHQVEAAISISGPSLRFGEEQILKFAEKLKETVSKIEKRL